MDAKSILLLAVLIICLTDVGRKQEVSAQDTKGGQSSASLEQTVTALKGGGRRFSSFRQNIASLQRKQLVAQTSQRPLQVQQEDSALSGRGSSTSSSSSKFSSSSVSSVDRPQLVEQQLRRVVSEQRLVANSIEQASADSEPALYGSVEGSPGVDFPAYTSIPNTKFTCDELPFNPGMYADESTGCQVYHLCYQGRRESFLCGIGTVFNQAIMNCDFWHSVECSKSSQYYHLNADFGKPSPEPAAGNQVQANTLSGNKSKTSSLAGNKTSTFKQQQEFASYRPVQAALRPSSGFRQTFSSISSSTSRTVEAPASQIGQFSGKVSAPKQSLDKLQSSGGFLSPSRQVQLMSGQQEQQQDQLMMNSAASSTRFKVTSGSSSGNQKLAAAPSLAVGSSLSVTSSSSQQTKTSQVRRKWPSVAKPQQAATETSGQNDIIQSAGGTDEWRPYFKSKASSTASAFHRDSNSGATSGPSPATATGSAVTSSEPPAEATVSAPDQEPTFSGGGSTEAPPLASMEPLAASEVPKPPKSGPPEASTSTAATTTATADLPTTTASESVEPDVGAALSTSTSSSAQPEDAATLASPTATSSLPAEEERTSSSEAPATSSAVEYAKAEPDSEVEAASTASSETNSANEKRSTETTVRANFVDTTNGFEKRSGKRA